MRSMFYHGNGALLATMVMVACVIGIVTAQNSNGEDDKTNEIGVNIGPAPLPPTATGPAFDLMLSDMPSASLPNESGSPPPSETGATGTMNELPKGLQGQPGGMAFTSDLPMPSEEILSSMWPTWSPEIAPSEELFPSAEVSMKVSEKPSSQPSDIPSPSVSPSQEPSPILSPAPRESMSATPSETTLALPSPSTSASVSVSATMSETASPSVSMSASTTPSMSILPTLSMAVTVTPSVSFSPSETPSMTSSATPSVTMSVTATAMVTPTVTPSSTMSTVMTMTATPSVWASPTKSSTPSASPENPEPNLKCLERFRTDLDMRCTTAVGNIRQDDVIRFRVETQQEYRSVKTSISVWGGRFIQEHAIVVEMGVWGAEKSSRDDFNDSIVTIKNGKTRGKDSNGVMVSHIADVNRVIIPMGMNSCCGMRYRTSLYLKICISKPEERCRETVISKIMRIKCWDACSKKPNGLVVEMSKTTRCSICIPRAGKK